MKKLLALISIISLLGINVVSAAETNFSDVDDSEVYQSGISYLRAQGIISGNPDGSFKPNQTLNRAEMIKILVGAYLKYEDIDKSIIKSYEGNMCFDDVDRDDWFSGYVCYAQELGWVTGYENGKKFRPAQTVNVVEALKMTLKAFNISYAEDSQVWYKHIVKNASKNNFIPHTIKGFSNGLKRNQMADMITRVLKKKEGKLNDYLGARKNILVTYESMELGKDVSASPVVCTQDAKICPDGSYVSRVAPMCEFAACPVVEKDDASTDETASSKSTGGSTSSPQTSAPASSVAASLHLIEITANGFGPNPLVINKGDNVTFLNSDTKAHWPASNNHPGHSVYPGSSSLLCGTDNYYKAFDSCKALNKDESYSFTFLEKGTWIYHDHLNPGTTGTITVK